VRFALFALLCGYERVVDLFEDGAYGKCHWYSWGKKKLMRSLAAILLATALFGCQEGSKVSPCQPEGREVYHYQDKFTGERMSMFRQGSNLLIDFHTPESDTSSSKVDAKILETDEYFDIMNVLVPKNFSGNSVSNSVTECRWRSDEAVSTLYRITCSILNEQASWVVLFDTQKGIVEWSTVGKDRSEIGGYILRSDRGLLHACLA
jgi:hypothetical protein